ncbi:MAG: hypothetical protein ACPGVO_01760 [Spirulinaceae cyanobacterium]
MKLNATLIGLTAGATLTLAPQLAQAQNSIAITGGSALFTVNTNPGNVSLTFTTSNQGTFTGTNSTTLLGQVCGSGCGQELYTAVSGSGFSPTGPVLFSNVPVVFQVDAFTAGVTSTILSGAFNSTTVVSSILPQATVDAIFNGDGIAGPLSSPDFSVGQFHFTNANFDTVTANTQTFTIADSLTGFGEEEFELEEIVGEDGVNTSRPQGRAFRPNGMHTRIIPAWTPGLYQ